VQTNITFVLTVTFLWILLLSQPHRCGIAEESPLYALRDYIKARRVWLVLFDNLQNDFFSQDIKERLIGDIRLVYE